MGTGELEHAFGAQVVADEYGAFRNTGFNGTYSIHLPINRAKNVSYRTRIGFTNHSFLKEKARILSDLEGEGIVDQTFQGALANGISHTFLDISSGAYLYSELYFFGIAACTSINTRFSVNRFRNYQL